MSAQISGGASVNALAPKAKRWTEQRLPSNHRSALKASWTLSAPAARHGLFCLGLAALMDGLTLAFSLACRRTRPALGRDPLAELELYPPFSASPSTLSRGYSLAADRAALASHERVVALLCQLDPGPHRTREEGETVAALALLLFANELAAQYQQGRAGRPCWNSKPPPPGRQLLGAARVSVLRGKTGALPRAPVLHGEGPLRFSLFCIRNVCENHL